MGRIGELLAQQTPSPASMPSTPATVTPARSRIGALMQQRAQPPTALRAPTGVTLSTVFPLTSQFFRTGPAVLPFTEPLIRAGLDVMGLPFRAVGALRETAQTGRSPVQAFAHPRPPASREEAFINLVGEGVLAQPLMGAMQAGARGLSRIGRLIRQQAVARGMIAPEVLPAARPPVARPRPTTVEAELVETPRGLPAPIIRTREVPPEQAMRPVPGRPLPPELDLPLAVTAKAPSSALATPTTVGAMAKPGYVLKGQPFEGAILAYERQAGVGTFDRLSPKAQLEVISTSPEAVPIKDLIRKVTGQVKTGKPLQEAVALRRLFQREAQVTRQAFAQGKQAGAIEATTPKPLTPKQNIETSTGLATQPPTVGEAAALKRSLQRQQVAARQAAVSTKVALLDKLSQHFSDPRKFLRVAQAKSLTPSQVGRIAGLYREQPGATIPGPRGGTVQVPLTKADIQRATQAVKGIVPRGITEAQRQRLVAGEPTRLPGGPNQPPPVIPTSTALVPSALRPTRDVPVSFTRATAEVDIQRAAQFVDGKPLGPVNRLIVQPAIQSDARAVAKTERKLAEFRALAKGIKKDSEIDAKLLRAVEDRALPGEVVSPGEQQFVEAWKTFAKVAIEEDINPVLVRLGKKPIAPRQNYAPHLPSLSFLSDLFGALERIPDELLERLPILRSVMETPIGQRDPSLPQAVKDLPYVPKHPSAFFLKPRIGGPFRESLLAGIEAYVPLWARITEVAPVAQSLKPMLSQMPPNFRAMAEQWVGELLGKRPRADVLIDANALRALTRVQRLSSSSFILARVTTVLLQYSSLANIAAKHGWFYTMRGLGRALTPQGRAFAELFSRELQQRMAVGTLLEGENTPLRIANAGLEFTDQQMVTAAFLTAFEHYTKMPATRFQQLAGTPQTFEDIVTLANISTEQSQASMRKALQSPVLRSQLLRATTSQLQTFNVNLRQQQFLDSRILAMATSKKEAALYVARLNANLVVMNLAYRFFGLRPPTDVSDMIPIFDPWTGGVPIGVIGKAVESKGRFVPAAALLATAAFKLAVDAKEDGKLNADTMRTLVKVLTMPIPAGSQIATSIDGALQVFQGGRRNRRNPARFDYRIDNPIDAVKAITLGPTFTRGYQEFRARKFQPEAGRQRLLRQQVGTVRRQIAPRRLLPR